MTLLLLTLAVPALAALVCRLDAINWRSTRKSVVAFHLVLFCYVVAIGVSVFTGEAPRLQDWLGVLVADLWVAGSWRSWRHGPPERTRRQPRQPAWPDSRSAR